MKQEFILVNSLGFKLFSDMLDKITFNDKLIINTLNQYSYCLAEQDEGFKEVLQKSDMKALWRKKYLTCKKL